jgi:hypothetical protein
VDDLDRLAEQFEAHRTICAKIAAIDILADPQRLRRPDLAVLDD